jgi:hypothetical protein
MFATVSGTPQLGFYDLIYGAVGSITYTPVPGMQQTCNVVVAISNTEVYCGGQFNKVTGSTAADNYQGVALYNVTTNSFSFLG